MVIELKKTAVDISGKLVKIKYRFTKLFIELLITDHKEKHNNNTLEELQTQIKMFFKRVRLYEHVQSSPPHTSVVPGVEKTEE